ncbi:MAG TPA: V-type ATP synthase subunit D [Synergistaceae bacterium]|nr:V-type ATP synthase subunit D [Synergistaceae bacterium]HPJ25223.1 V-type ATP synthase subunit D [Synergistaceae bacterium]HPQ36094.1 V-type ATP synthase subunit D [Synergistaceae bacterium]
MPLPITREQLLLLRRQSTSVSRGLHLLEKKRDALIRTIEEDRRRFEELRRRFEKESELLGISYTQLRLFEGAFSLDLLRSNSPTLSVREEKHAVMGCVFPQFYPEGEEAWEVLHRQKYDPALSSFFVDDLMEGMRRMAEFLWEYINILTRLNILNKELQKIRRKAGNLEHNILPVMQEEIARIQDSLQERERQERQVRKRVARRKITSGKTSLS